MQIHDGLDIHGYGLRVTFNDPSIPDSGYLGLSAVADIEISAGTARYIVLLSNLDVSTALIKGPLLPDVASQWDIGAPAGAGGPWANLYLKTNADILFNDIVHVRQLSGGDLGLTAPIGNHVMVVGPTGFQASFETSSMSADHTYTFPNKSGTFAMTSDVGIVRSIVVTSGNVTMGAVDKTDYVYLVAGAHTITCPTAVGNTNRYTVKNNHSANITVNTTSSQTIDGTTSISIAPQSSVDLISTNANWSII